MKLFTFCWIFTSVNIFSSVTSAFEDSYYDEDSLPLVRPTKYPTRASTTTSKVKCNVKLTSWNVFGIRAWCKKGGHEYILTDDPDILCLQSVRCSLTKMPPEMNITGYDVYWHEGVGQKHSGVAIFTKVKPLEVTFGIGETGENVELDFKGRLITAEYENYYVVNAFTPPMSGFDLKSVATRVKWDKSFRDYVRKLDKKKPVIIAGDLNVSHKEIDVCYFSTNSSKHSGITNAERFGFDELLELGFVDTFRHFYPERIGAYTFWGYFKKDNRMLNLGAFCSVIFWSDESDETDDGISIIIESS